MDFLIYGVVSFFILLAFFANIMTFKKKADKLPKLIYYFLYVIGYAVFICDILWNIIFGSVLFFELPSKKRLTLTARMKHLILFDEGWRFKVAYFICRYIVEPWDWNHCGLRDL